jgi:hypothetical protein
LDAEDEEDVGLEPLDIAFAFSNSDARDRSRGERGSGSSDRSTTVLFDGEGVVAADVAEFGTKISAGGAARNFGATVEEGIGASSGRNDSLLAFEVGLATI